MDNNTEQTPDEKPVGRLCAMAMVFVVAMVMRVGLVSTFDPTSFGFSDPSYLQYAENFHEGRGFYMDGVYGDAGPDRMLAFRPPLFPFIWGLLYGVTGGAYRPMWYGFAILSSIGCVLAYRIGLRLFDDELPALIGGVLCAVYPPLVFHGVNLMTEPFFIYFGIATVLFLMRAWDRGSELDAALAGIFFGLTVLSRSALVGFAPVAALWLLVRGRAKKEEGGMKRSLPSAVLFCAALALTMAPWIIRNFIVLESFVPTTTDAGHGFYVANNPRTLGDTRGFYMPDDWSFLLREGEESIGEVEANRRLFREAFAYLRANPGDWARLLWERFLWFWRPFPKAEHIAMSRVIIYAISFIPIAPFIIAGLILSYVRQREYRWKYLLIYLMVLYTWGIHTIFLTTIRYREPLMPFLLLFAGYALWRLAKVYAAWRRTNEADMAS